MRCLHLVDHVFALHNNLPAALLCFGVQFFVWVECNRCFHHLEKCYVANCVANANGSLKREIVLGTELRENFFLLEVRWEDELASVRRSFGAVDCAVREIELPCFAELLHDLVGRSRNREEEVSFLAQLVDEVTSVHVHEVLLVTDDERAHFLDVFLHLVAQTTCVRVEQCHFEFLERATAIDPIFVVLLNFFEHNARENSVFHEPVEELGVNRRTEHSSINVEDGEFFLFRRLLVERFHVHSARRE